MLLILSKIYERHIYDSLYTYLTEKKNYCIDRLQSGFRRSHSTETALIRLVDQLLFEPDQDKLSALLCVDFSKAFDLINRDILIAKLMKYLALMVTICSTLFRSYITGRRQYASIASIKEERSSMREIKNRVL